MRDHATSLYDQSGHFDLGLRGEVLGSLETPAPPGVFVCQGLPDRLSKDCHGIVAIGNVVADSGSGIKGQGPFTLKLAHEHQGPSTQQASPGGAELLCC